MTERFFSRSSFRMVCRINPRLLIYRSRKHVHHPVRTSKTKKTSERYESVVNTPLSSCLMTGYLASTLKSNNHDVDIVDANLYGWSFNETIQELKKRKLQIIRCSSCLFVGEHGRCVWRCSFAFEGAYLMYT